MPGRAAERSKAPRDSQDGGMTAGTDGLLTVRWRDRSFVLRVPEQVGELARRLRQKGLASHRVID
jgi:hypothetical protein